MVKKSKSTKKASKRTKKVTKARKTTRKVARKPAKKTVKRVSKKKAVKKVTKKTVRAKKATVKTKGKKLDKKTDKKDFIKRCPECNSINLSSDEKRGEVICKSCEGRSPKSEVLFLDTIFYLVDFSLFEYNYSLDSIWNFTAAARL